MDRNLKMGVINDAFSIVVPPDWSEENSKRGANTSKENQVGNFTLIIDENSAEPTAKGGRIDKQTKRLASNVMWK